MWSEQTLAQSSDGAVVVSICWKQLDSGSGNKPINDKCLFVHLKFSVFNYSLRSIHVRFHEMVSGNKSRWLRYMAVCVWDVRGRLEMERKKTIAVPLCRFHQRLVLVFANGICRLWISTPDWLTDWLSDLLFQFIRGTSSVCCRQINACIFTFRHLSNDNPLFVRIYPQP